jgi:hypothetical protein
MVKGRIRLLEIGVVPFLIHGIAEDHGGLNRSEISRRNGVNERVRAQNVGCQS